MPRKKKESDVNIVTNNEVDIYSVDNFPDTLLGHIKDLSVLMFVNEEFINYRAGTLSYASLWLKESLFCITIMHKELKHLIREHNLSNKVVPIGGVYKTKECLLPFHLAMIKSAEMAKNILCIFEANYMNVEVNDNNVRRYFDCMFGLDVLLDQCNKYVELMDNDYSDDDGIYGFTEHTLEGDENGDDTD